MKLTGNMLLALILLFPICTMAQLNEKIDRGVVALTLSGRQVYVGWRLLKEDQKDVAFNLYRKDIGIGDFEKVNPNPIVQSTNYLDTTAIPGHGYLYKVKTIHNKVEKESAGEAYVFTLNGNQ